MRLKKGCKDPRDMKRCKAATNHHRYNSSWGFRVRKIAFKVPRIPLFPVIQRSSSRRLYKAKIDNTVIDSSVTLPTRCKAPSQRQIAADTELIYRDGERGDS